MAFQDDFPSVKIPASQLAIRNRCYHPTGSWELFPATEVEQSIPARLRKISKRYPARLALADRRRSVTYRQFDEESNRIAHAILRLCGQGSEPVALMFEHDVDAVIALMGVLKSGKFYVPIDPTDPDNRLKAILTDTESRLIVAPTSLIGRASALAAGSVQVLDYQAGGEIESTGDTGIEISPSDYAYIVYTSGSTGQPKGVIENHRNVLRFSMNYVNAYHICPDDRIAQCYRLRFSGSKRRLYGGLTSGASLYLYDLYSEGMDALEAFIDANGITVMGFVPPAFRRFVATLEGVDRCPSLRLIILGADRILAGDIDLYQEHFADSCILRTGIGSSEAKVWTEFFIDKSTRITTVTAPLGYPVQAVTIQIVDDSHEPVDPGEAGEIVVISPHISPGYWRRPELNAERFADSAQPGVRLYFTGDRGMLLKDGGLIHLGRNDRQVKIRGVRVEMAEVEKALGDLESVEHAEVVTWDNTKGERQLAGFVVASKTVPFDERTARRELARVLPPSMVPSILHVLGEFPLNANNKIDRNALSRMALRRATTEHNIVAPRNGIEEQLLEIWQDVLERRDISVRDEFLQLGGDSMLAMRMLNRIRDRLAAEIPLRVVFDSPTIAEMANALVESGDVQYDR